jgi:hypothetical protein
MTLQVIDGGGGDDEGGRRILAPGAPPSDGPIPNELAMHLQHGEVLAWWGRKDAIQFGPIALTFGAAVLVLALASAFAPGLWTGGWSAMWAPVLALLSPTLFVLAREWVGRGAVMVTHEAVIEVEPNGQPHRIALGAIRAVRRDWVRGGVQLIGARQLVRIPPMLMDDTRAAIASRLRGMVRGAEPDDPLGWLQALDKAR